MLLLLFIAVTTDDVSNISNSNRNDIRRCHQLFKTSRPICDANRIVRNDYNYRCNNYVFTYNYYNCSNCYYSWYD